MRTLLPRPQQDFFGWLTTLASRKPASEPSLWEDSICRSIETPATGRRNVRASGSTPLLGGSLLR